MSNNTKLDLSKFIRWADTTNNEFLSNFVSTIFNSFVSEENNYTISGTIGQPITGLSQIKQDTFHRQLNEIDCAILTNIGSEEKVLTFEDIINRFKILGVDLTNIGSTLEEEAFNFAPPINVDKFINFKDYYWVKNEQGVSNVMGWNSSLDPEYYVMERTPVQSDWNDWQKSNKWLHKDNDLFKTQVYDINNCIQAKMSIIEYSSVLELNNRFGPTGPIAPSLNLADNNFVQQKTLINQVPLFNLYVVDGTHAGIVSSIFKYSESPSGIPDFNLGIRLNKNANDDYLFSINVYDNKDRLLYFRKNNQLVSIWTKTSEKEPVEFKKLNDDGEIINYPGGYTSTATDGAWKTPSRLFRNLERKASKIASFTELSPHFLSVRDNQTSDFFDYTRGGCIRDYGSNLPLLISLINQDVISVSSILEFAERQYQSALSNAESFIITEFSGLLTSSEIPLITEFGTNSNVISLILRKYEQYRSSDTLLNSTFSDTSCKLKAWPITLPMFGLIKAVEPQLNYFDFDLGINAIRHHDGHISPMVVDDVNTNILLANTLCLRSDGSSSPGTISPSAPSTPFARQLWFNPSSKQLKFFNVRYDTGTAPTIAMPGDYWFNRDSGVLYERNENAWLAVTDPQTYLDRWEIIDFASIRNHFILRIEQQLFNSVPSYFKDNELLLDIKDDAETSELMSFELARFSQKYNYDTYAPDFDQTDPFTWNYAQANIPGITPKARWYDVYKEYFTVASNSYDIIPTSRPNLEPWKLLGLSSGSSPYEYNGALKPFIEHFQRSEVDTARRFWKSEMWDHIKSLRPNVKLCVYTADSLNLSDTLLPPFVSTLASEEQKENALLVSDQLPAGISLGYEFGQNGPIEGVWKKSIEYNYSLAISAFKINPLMFIDRSWGISYVSANDDSLRVERNLLRSPSHGELLIHGEKQHHIEKLSTLYVSNILSGLLLPQDEKITISFTSLGNNLFFELYDKLNNKIKVVRNSVEKDYATLDESFSVPSLGISSFTLKSTGHIYENGEKISIENVNGTLVYEHVPPIRKSYLGLAQLFANAIRYSFGNSEISLISNLFKKWNTKICHRFSSTVVPESLIVRTQKSAVMPNFFSIKLLKNEKVAVKRITALRVQLVDMGPVVDNTGTLTRIRNSSGVFVPTTDASSWIFRLEGYDTNYPLLNYSTTDQDSEFQTFKALNGKNCDLDWKKYNSFVSDQSTSTLPLLITGLQNLIDIIYGYVNHLEKQGWTSGIRGITNIDSETGYTVSWQLEIEKLIDKVYSGISAGEGFILNPFMDELSISTPLGLLSSFDDAKISDNFLNQVVNDVIGDKIPLNNISVTRTNEKAVIKSSTPIYSARIYTDEYEHAIIFNNTYDGATGPIDVFNKLNGVVEKTFILKYNKQDAVNKKPILSGYILNKDSFSRNLMSDIDKIGNFYDSNLSFGDSTTRKHSLALLGFNKKEYFENLSLDEKTQFNFWKGLIQAKGSNVSLDAFLNHKESVASSVDEIWAYKVATFGDSREKVFPEVRINSVDCAQLYTRLQFFNQSIRDYKLLPLYTQIASDDDSRWFSIDDLGTHLKFETQRISETIEVTGEEGYPRIIRLKNIYINEDASSLVITGPRNPRIVNSRTVRVNAPGKYQVSGHTWLTPSKFSPIKLFDYASNTLIEEIGLWHPAIGINAYRPLEIVNVISSDNPAFYTNSLMITVNPSLRKLKPWSKGEVGTVWWNTSGLDYLPYYDSKIFPNRQTRETLWGGLAEWSEIQLYEWTESNVHPSEYDELSKAQEGNTEIPISERAAGKVAIKRSYFRDRIFEMRPIAWSQVGSATGNAHPAFGSATFSKMYVVGSSLVAESNTLENLNIRPNMRFSAWKDEKPFGEVVIGDASYKILGSSISLNEPFFDVTNLFSASVMLTDEAQTISRVGKILISKKIDRTTDTAIGPEGNPETVINEKHFIKLTDEKGVFEMIEVTDWYSYDNIEDSSIKYTFDTFGVEITITRKDTSPRRILAFEIAELISTASYDLVIREGAAFTEIIPLPDTVFINDQLDPEYLSFEYEWRSWLTPSQDELNNDLAYEPRKWKPYIGDFQVVQISPQVITMVKEDVPLVLKDGASLSRFKTAWTQWTELLDEHIEKVSNGFDLITFDFSEQVNSERLFVYVNGQRILSGFNISNRTVEMNKTFSEGFTITAILKKYSPTQEELSFVPEENDDISIIKNFKLDYEFTEEIRRDDNGNAVGKKYFFWVKDKTIPNKIKSISLVQAQKMLKDGDTQYSILTNLVNLDNNYYFDSCIIRGLNYIVTKDNSYKLRFIRDFTLRDDPEELSLKNTHTQWQQIRRNQDKKIPLRLWQLLTDAICAEDISGNPLPDASRTQYDIKNKTRTRFGFNPGQILASTDLLRASVLNSILNTKLQIKVGDKTVPFYISSLNFSKRDEWFSSAEKSRETMDFIWDTASVKQINDILFNALDDIQASSFDISDIIKTSMIHVTIQKNI
jgi:hypothetical protein